MDIYSLGSCKEHEIVFSKLLGLKQNIIKWSRKWSNEQYDSSPDEREQKKKTD